MDQLGKFFSIVFLSLGAIFLNTMVIFWLWHWIIMKTFDTIWLTFPQAFGFSVLISFLKSRRVVTTLKEGQTAMDVFLENAGWSFTNSFFFLALGWLASLFI